MTPPDSRTQAQHAHFLLLASGAFALLAAVLAMFFARQQEAPAAGALRMNSIVSLPTAAPAIRCTDIANVGQVRLFVNGMDSGIAGAGCTDNPATIVFLFRHIKPAYLSAEQDRAVWTAILGHPLDTLHTPRRLQYDIRWVKGDGAVVPLTPGQRQAVLVIFDRRAPLALAFILWVWFLLAYLGRVSALVRDGAPPGTPLRQRTFSLARTQMAWWFGIIFASFLFLWLVTGETPSVSPQALVLLGISAVTTVASTGVTGGATSAAGEPGKFFVDLLSDGNGIAIHRFQMLAMTITLGLLFLFDVATTLTMPEFDGSLLTLMGISAGTYVALKIPAQPAGEQPSKPATGP